MESIYKKIHETIIEVWRYDIKCDYKQYLLLREDTLKNALYFHIRNRLGDAFMKDNHLAIFTEYKIDTNETIDLVVVKLDMEKVNDYELKDCVKEIIAIIEIKYKKQSVTEKIFIDDVKKILNYTKMFKFEYTKFFLAFIRERYFYEDGVTNFLSKFEDLPSGKIVELLSYGSIEEDDMVWKVFES